MGFFLLARGRSDLSSVDCRTSHGKEDWRVRRDFDISLCLHAGRISSYVLIQLDLETSD